MKWLSKKYLKRCTSTYYINKKTPEIPQFSKDILCKGIYKLVTEGQYEGDLNFMKVIVIKIFKKHKFHFSSYNSMYIIMSVIKAEIL